MATNLLVRRLGGLSSSLVRSFPLPTSPSLPKFGQHSRALSSLFSPNARPRNDPSAVFCDLPAANCNGFSVRWKSYMPAPVSSTRINEPLDSAGERWRRHALGEHPNCDLVLPKYRKVKPHIVKRRVRDLRTYVGAEKNIRYSPWRMNLICRFAAGMTVPEADNQLRFVRKRKAPLLRKVIKRTANLADIRHGLQPSQLEVAECFATHGHHLKRLKIQARGKNGIMHHRFCHIRLVLREIDFPLKVALATTEHQKRRWLEKMKLADLDAADAAVEREELERLKKEAEEKKAKEEKK